MTSTTVTFPSGDLTLAGTLTTPDGPGPFPAAVLVSGSGPIDRDSNMKRAQLNVMSQVAEHLAANGIASLRYDKRGVGESDGDYNAAGFFDNVADARAALDALEQQDVIDSGRIFVVGHSEGALIATELASEQPPAGVVLLAGAAQRGKAVLQWQAAQLAKTLPAPAKFIMRLLRQDLAKTNEKRLAQLEATTGDTARIQMAKVNAKWFREFMAHDPSESLAEAIVPVLAITGSKDVQVDPRDIARMESVAPSRFTGHVLDGVTHLLRTDDGPAGTKTYKAQMKQPVDETLLNIVSDWIQGYSDGADNGVEANHVGA
ncbi:MAG: alpha/beta fold hydrolase [Acidimicrobiia bacterium]|nr:alpha/beta fold hydrolase [Acidimicrobiia bacterium]